MAAVFRYEDLRFGQQRKNLWNVDCDQKLWTDHATQFKFDSSMLALQELVAVMSMAEQPMARDKDNGMGQHQMQNLTKLTKAKARSREPQGKALPNLDNIPLPKFVPNGIPLQTDVQTDCKEETLKMQNETGEDVLKADAAVQAGQDYVERTFCRVPPPPMPLTDFIESETTIQFNGVFASVGSIGHPTNCADACKYYRKAGGCKQGQLCTRCHLCKRRHLGRWRRPVVQHVEFGTDVSGSSEDSLQLQEAGVDTKDLEISSSLIEVSGNESSIGSLGHPTRCGPACRYTWRKSGCKNGQGCLCCHVCTWSRQA
jgi:hypothetical protein